MTTRRRTSPFLLLGALGLVAAGTPAGAQQAIESPGRGGALTLSLQEALTRGLTEGQEVQITASQEAELAAEVRAARAAAFPQIDAQASYSRALRTPFGDLDLGSEAEDNSLPFGQEDTYDARITLAQPLYSGGRVGTGLEIAREASAAATAQSDEVRRELALAITEAYYGAVLAQRLEEISEATRDLIGQQLEQIRLLREAGNASDLDVLRVEVERENVEPELVAARNAEAVALLDLKRLLNLPRNVTVELTTPLAADGFKTVSPQELDGLTAGALERRSSIEGARRQARILELQVKLARASFLPDVALTATFAEQAFPADGTPSFSDFKDDWSVALAVRLPLFTGGRRAAEVRVAEERSTQSRLQLAQLEEGVALEIERLRGEIERTIVLLEARSRNTGSAERVYELTELSYKQGVATNLELQDARLDLQRARASEAQALHDYFLAMARLLRETAAPWELRTLDLVRTASMTHPGASPGPTATPEEVTTAVAEPISMSNPSHAERSL